MTTTYKTATTAMPIQIEPNVWKMPSLAGKRSDVEYIIKWHKSADYAEGGYFQCDCYDYVANGNHHCKHVRRMLELLKLRRERQKAEREAQPERASEQKIRLEAAILAERELAALRLQITQQAEREEQERQKAEALRAMVEQQQAQMQELLGLAAHQAEQITKLQAAAAEERSEHVNCVVGIDHELIRLRERVAELEEQLQSQAQSVKPVHLTIKAESVKATSKPRASKASPPAEAPERKPRRQRRQEEAFRLDVSGIDIDMSQPGMQALAGALQGWGAEEQAAKKSRRKKTA